jgi:hypothetical protein
LLDAVNSRLLDFAQHVFCHDAFEGHQAHERYQDSFSHVQ